MTNSNSYKPPFSKEDMEKILSDDSASSSSTPPLLATPVTPISNSTLLLPANTVTPVSNTPSPKPNKSQAPKRLTPNKNRSLVVGVIGGAVVLIGSAAGGYFLYQQFNPPLPTLASPFSYTTNLPTLSQLATVTPPHISLSPTQTLVVGHQSATPVVLNEIKVVDCSPLYNVLNTSDFRNAYPSAKIISDVSIDNLITFLQNKPGVINTDLLFKIQTVRLGSIPYNHTTPISPVKPITALIESPVAKNYICSSIVPTPKSGGVIFPSGGNSASANGGNTLHALIEKYFAHFNIVDGTTIDTHVANLTATYLHQNLAAIERFGETVSETLPYMIDAAQQFATNAVNGYFHVLQNQLNAAATLADITFKFGPALLAVAPYTIECGKCIREVGVKNYIDITIYGVKNSLLGKFATTCYKIASDLVSEERTTRGLPVPV
jgi:hypothetical protein